MLHTIFFDLDNTLYPPESGVWDAIGQRINSFVMDIVGMPPEEVPAFRRYCRENFGTTLAGLKSIYQIDDDQYLDYVHDIDLSKHLVRDERLSSLLQTSPQRKIVFTNSDQKHARRVLAFLGIEEFFDQIIDIFNIYPYVKPQKESFLKALQLAGMDSPAGCVFLDDFLENVISAQELGFFSILVGKQPESDYPLQIADIYALPSLLDGHNSMDGKA